MLGLSLSKLVILVLLGVTAWWFLSRGNRMKARHSREMPRDNPKNGNGIQDMTACTVCGAYVSSQVARNCGKAACPY